MILHFYSKILSLQRLNFQTIYLIMQINKKIIFPLVLFCTILNVKAELNYLVIDSDSVSFSVVSPSNYSLPDSVINYGKLFLKTPYRYGSTGTNSFDCSGFTSYVYRNFGYNLNRTSSDQSDQFPTVARDELKTGDLVFFEGRRHNGRVGHVGIVVATNDSGHFDFIHAAVRSGVTISNSKESYYTKRFIKAGRIIGSDTTARIKGVTPKMNRDEYVSFEPAKSVKVNVPAKYHKVKKGENLSTIAEKYGLTLTALKQKNKLKKNNINVNQRLKIKDAESYTKAETIVTNNKVSDVNNESSPENTLTPPENSLPQVNSHTVKKGDNLNSIAKLYKISISDLKKLNNLKNSRISIGQELKLTESENRITVENKPEIEIAKTEEAETSKSTSHKVKPGESLFTISRKYNVSIDDIKKINHLINNNLVSGQMLEINSEMGSIQPNPQIAETKSQPEKAEKISEKVKNNHKIKKGESLYTIAKLYRMSIDELKLMNQLEDSKIKPGQVLLVSQTESSPDGTITNNCISVHYISFMGVGTNSV